MRFTVLIPTTPCGPNRCVTCSLVTNTASDSYKGRDVAPVSLGTSIILCFLCLNDCQGKTVSCSRTRVNGNRAFYYRVLVDPIKTVINNLFTENKYNNDLSLGYHLHKEHHCKY